MLPDPTQTLSVEPNRKRIETVIPYLEAGAEDALSAASKSARENHVALQAEYLNERDELLAFAAQCRAALSHPEHQGDEEAERIVARIVSRWLINRGAEIRAGQPLTGTPNGIAQEILAALSAQLSPDEAGA